MHKSSSFAVIVCTLLINQYICSPKSDDNWWNDFKTKLESRPKSQWTTLDNKTVPVLPAATTRSVKRSSAAFDDDFTDSPFRTRSRNWEKSYARRRDFDRTWKDDQPVRERFSETEWDDDVPVRHVFRDSNSAVDEGNNRNRMGDDIQPERMSRPWSRGDYNGNNDETVKPRMREVFNSARSLNKNNNNNNNNNKSNTNNSSNKPKVVTNSYDNRSPKQSKSDRTDRVLNLGFGDSDTKKKDRERLDQLAKQIFSMDNEERDSTRSTGITGSTGSTGNGYVTNAVNSFTRNSGNTYVTTKPENDFNRNTNKKNSNNNKFGNDFVNPMKPKYNVMFETTAKPDRTSNTAKTNANDIRNVAEKPKTSTTPSSPSSQLKFGWRSSISHTNDQKIQNQKLQNNNNNEEIDDNLDDNFDGEDYNDDTTTARTFTTRAPTRMPTRATTRPLTRTTTRTTTRPQVEYTTYNRMDTTRPQTTYTTNKANRETTIRPKPITPKTSTNAMDKNLAPNRKQHRMGSWVDSDNLDYEEGDNNEFDDRALVDDRGMVDDRTFVDDRAPIDDISQPIVEEEEFDAEQLPERVEDSPELPPPEPLKFARQSAATGEGEGDDDKPGWRLEDALPGVPGTDYPTFATIPKTAFDCKTHEWPGYYADVETQCQVFHICQTGGRKNSFLCPNGTMFNQQVFVCDWWHNVQCGDSVTHYPLNENIYDHNWESKRVTKTETEGTVRRSGTLVESAEPLIGADMDSTTAPADSDSESNDSKDSVENMKNTDNSNDGSNEFTEEVDNEETGRATRVRSPIRIFRTSRIITAQDRQKRRRRKRGYLKA